MKRKHLPIFFLLGGLLIFSGCAGTLSSRPFVPQAPPIPLEKANLEMMLEEQQGLEITWEDAKDLRDFYRGGVQKKAEADKNYREKNYADALRLYDSSNEFFIKVLKYNNEDVEDFPLFEGTSILFFPNLLVADNDLKMGLIFKETGHESSARRKWKQAIRYVQQSLQSQPTELGLSVQKEILSYSKSQ